MASLPAHIRIPLAPRRELGSAHFHPARARHVAILLSQTRAAGALYDRVAAKLSIRARPGRVQSPPQSVGRRNSRPESYSCGSRDPQLRLGARDRAARDIFRDPGPVPNLPRVVIMLLN